MVINDGRIHASLHDALLGNKNSRNCGMSELLLEFMIKSPHCGAAFLYAIKIFVAPLRRTFRVTETFILSMNTTTALASHRFAENFQETLY